MANGNKLSGRNAMLTSNKYSQYYQWIMVVIMNITRYNNRHNNIDWKENYCNNTNSCTIVDVQAVCILIIQWRL